MIIYFNKSMRNIHILSSYGGITFFLNTERKASFMSKNSLPYKITFSTSTEVMTL